MRRQPWGLITAAVVFAAAFLVAPVGGFVQTTWTGGTGNWDTDALWNTGNEPTAADETIINNGGTVQLTMAGEAASEIHVGNGAGTSGTLQVTGAGRLTSLSVVSGAGAGASGSVLVSGGGGVTTGATVIGMSAAIGTATVEGATSALTVTGVPATIGNGGNGTLTVRDGGVVTAANGLELAANGGTGTINVGTGGGAGTLSADVTSGAASGTATLNFNHTGTTTYANVISGDVAVNKLGSGTLTVTGANTYTGATNVSAGSLVLTGSLTSNVSANAGGTLMGTGTAAGAVVVNANATLAPGTSIGTLTVGGDVNFAAGADFEVELAAAGAGDRLDVAGSVALGNADLGITLLGGYVHSPGTVFEIITSANPVAGTFANGPILTVGGNSFRVDYTTNPNRVSLVALATPLVAPATLPAMTVGEPFNATITGSGGVAPYTFAVTVGALPAGLTLTAGTGVIAGTPTTAGPYGFTITVTDSLGVNQSQAYSGTVDPVPVPSVPFVGLMMFALLLGGIGWARLRSGAAV